MIKNKCPPGTFVVQTGDPDSIARFVSELRESITKLTHLLLGWMEPFLSEYFEIGGKGLPIVLQIGFSKNCLISGAELRIFQTLWKLSMILMY